MPPRMSNRRIALEVAGRLRAIELRLTEAEQNGVLTKSDLKRLRIMIMRLQKRLFMIRDA